MIMKKKPYWTCLLFVFLFVSFPLLFSMETPPAPELPFNLEPTTASPSYETAFIKMIITVIGLVFLVILTIWVMRRLGQGRFHSLGSNRSIQIIEKKPLSPKSMLYLVEIANQQFLIAESQLEVKTIGKLEIALEKTSNETS